MLSNDAARPTFNTISHEEHEEIVYHKPSPLYSILQFTYPQEHIATIHKIDTIQYYIRSCNVLTLDSSLLRQPEIA
jgi:hypothetical protein